MCAAVDFARLGALDEIVVHSHYAPRQAIFEEGGHADYVYNVTNGNIRLYKLLADGRRQITGFLRPGDFLGLIKQNAYSYGAEAIDKVELCCIRVIDLERLMTEIPAVRDRLLDMGRDELMAAQEQMLLLGRKSAKEKLLSFLLLRLREEGRTGNQRSVTLDLPMTRRDIGDYLGLSLETVSRTFAELRKEGLIELPLANCVIIPNFEKFQEVAVIE
jgi:CRP/FNR family transcriptional regulator